MKEYISIEDYLFVCLFAHIQQSICVQLSMCKLKSILNKELSLRDQMWYYKLDTSKPLDHMAKDYDYASTTSIELWVFKK